MGCQKHLQSTDRIPGLVEETGAWTKIGFLTCLIHVASNALVI